MFFIGLCFALKRHKMKTIRTLTLILITIFCANVVAQSQPIQGYVADKTFRDLSVEKNKYLMFETCQAELKIALQDPDKYAESKTQKIGALLDDKTLAYWETYALATLLRTGAIKNLYIVSRLTRSTIDVLETINSELRSKEENKKRWSFVYTFVDFIHGKIASCPKVEADAVQLIDILTSVSIGYGEKALDIDGDLDKPVKQDTDPKLNVKFNNDATVTSARSRGVAVIEQAAKRDDEDVSYGAIKALAYIAGAEKQKSVDPKEIESIRSLEDIAYYNPLFGGTKPECIVDYQRGDRNSIERKQTQTIAYLGMLGEKDFLKTYMDIGYNKAAQNTAAEFLNKEAPNPYYNLTNGVSNLIGTLDDLAKMGSFQKVSWTEIPFSGGSTGWAESKLIAETSKNTFSFEGTSVLNYTIEPSINGIGIATLQIPTMTEFIPFISAQWWSLPKALSPEVINSLLYVVRIVPSTAVLIDNSEMYKIDAINKEVTILSNVAEIDVTKPYATVIMTLADGKIIKYRICISDASDKQKIMDYIKLSSPVNLGVKMEVKYSDNGLTAGASTKSIVPIISGTNVIDNLSSQTVNKINSLLKNTNLSFKEQYDVLNAFKSRTSLASPKILTKFMDGNSIYANVEVFTNPNGATVLKIVRGLTSADGIINFARNFTYDVNGNIVEKDSVDYADGSGAIALDNETAALLEGEIANYNNFCKNFTPKIN